MRKFSQSKYFYVEEIEHLAKPKTKVYHIFSESSDELIAVIKWYAPWRQYCFYPKEDTVWSRGCLIDINSFLKELMDERKSVSPKVAQEKTK